MTFPSLTPSDATTLAGIAAIIARRLWITRKRKKAAQKARTNARLEQITKPAPVATKRA